MRKTPVFSAKIWNGSRILRFMSAGCGMFDLRFRFRIGLNVRFAGVCFSLRFVNRPDHVEGAFRVVFELVPQDSFAAIERVFEADEFPLDATKLLGGEERLREEPLQPP